MFDLYRSKCDDLMERFQCTASVLEDDDGPYILVEMSGDDVRKVDDRLVKVQRYLEKGYTTHGRGVQQERGTYVARLTVRSKSDDPPPAT